MSLAQIFLDSLNNFDFESSTIKSKNIWKILPLDYPFLDEILKYFQKALLQETSLILTL